MDLDADKREFVEVVMFPLGADDARRELLERSILTAARKGSTSNGDSVKVAARRMRETAACFRIKHCLIVWGMVSLAVAVLWFFFLSPAALRSTQMLLRVSPDVPMPKVIQRICSRNDAELFLQQRLTERLPASRLQIATGDFHQKPAARWKVVWDASPENPAHYFAYAQAVWWEYEKWPADMVETGERLDPENGWFRLLKVGSRMKEAVIPAPASRSGKRREAGKVKDDKVLHELLEELDLVIRKPRLDDYRSRLKRLRLDAWPPPSDFPDYILSFKFSFKHPENHEFGLRDGRNLGDIFSAAANSAALKGDREGLDRIATQFLRLLDSLTSSPDFSLIKYYVASYVSIYGGRSIADAYAKIGEEQKAARYTGLADYTDPAVSKSPPKPSDALQLHHGSSLMIWIPYGYAPDSKPVSEDELKGGRLAEYAMMERALMLLEIAMLLVILLFFILVPLKDRKECGPLGGRLSDLLRWSDHSWILLAGLLLPAAVYVGVRSHAWYLPGRFASDPNDFNFMMMQGAALLLSIVFGVIQVARWRLGRKGRALGLGWRGFDPGWCFYLLAMILIPLSPLTGRFYQSMDLDDKMTVFISWSPLGFPLLWLLVMACYHFAGASGRRLHRLVLVRTVAPFIAMALLLAAVGVVFVHAEERKWTARIDFEAITPERPAFEARLHREYLAWRRSNMLRALQEMH